MDQAGAQHSQSPITAEDGGGDGDMLTRQMVGIVVNCSPREIVNRQIGAISKGTTPKFKRGHSL
jgi:hypothetical protein